MGIFEFLLILLGFFGGVTSFYLDNPAPPWGDEATFRGEALRFAAELLGSGPLFTGFSHLSWGARISALTLPCVIFSLLCVCTWFWIRNPLRRLVIAGRGGHLVVAGPPEAAALVLSWQRPTLWVVPGPLTLSARAGLPRHAALVCGDLGERQTQEMAACREATGILLLDDDGARNGHSATALLGNSLVNRYAASPCVVHVSFQTAPLAREFERRLEPHLLPDGVEVNLFHPQALGVRQLFLELPTERFRFSGGAPCTRVAVIGLGSWGEEVLKHLMLGCHPLAPRVVEICVADRDALHLGQLFAENHECPLLPPIQWVPIDVKNERAFGEWLDGQISQSPPPCAYFVCLGGGELSYSTSLRLESSLRERLAQAVPIFYHSHTTRVGSRSEASCLYPFGSGYDTLTDELVLQSKRDTVARQVHEAYLKSCLDAGAQLGDRPALVEWSRLPLTFKQENRSQADHHLFKIRQIGCRVRAAAKPAAYRFEHVHLELLAAAEHRRWCTSRFLSGWRYGSHRDDARKLHPDLVPYEMLSERVKGLDRDAVANLPMLFSTLGLEIVPDLTVAIAEDCQVADADLHRAGKGALEALQAEEPQHHPVLLVDLKSRVSRQIGLGWYTGGGTVWLVLDEPVYLVRDRQGQDERMSVDYLVSHAEKTVVLPRDSSTLGLANRLVVLEGDHVHISTTTADAEVAI